MEKSVVLRDGSVLQIFRPRGENAAEILEYLKTIGGETHFLLMDENGLGISEEEERLILEENLKQERGGVYGGGLPAYSALAVIRAAGWRIRGKLR